MLFEIVDDCLALVERLLTGRIDEERYLVLAAGGAGVVIDVGDAKIQLFSRTFAQYGQSSAWYSSSTLAASCWMMSVLSRRNHPAVAVGAIDATAVWLFC